MPVWTLTGRGWFNRGLTDAASPLQGRLQVEGAGVVGLPSAVMHSAGRFVVCLFSGCLIALPIWHEVSDATNDSGGGYLASGIMTGVGIGIFAALIFDFIERHDRDKI